MYEYFSQVQRTPVVLLRLNYATERRYKVLVDLAQQIAAGEPIDVTMSCVNGIWLRDTNAMTLPAPRQAVSPARVLNLAGPEMVSVADVSARLGALMVRPVRLACVPGADVLLSSGTRGHAPRGHAEWTTERMIKWTAR